MIILMHLTQMTYVRWYFSGLAELSKHE